MSKPCGSFSIRVNSTPRHPRPPVPLALMRLKLEGAKVRKPRDLWILVLATAFNGVLMAQTTLATINGLVTDAVGSIVPGVKIEVTNTNNNYKYSATSNEAGQYTVAGMLNGPYTFRATA